MNAWLREDGKKLSQRELWDQAASLYMAAHQDFVRTFTEALCEELTAAGYAEPWVDRIGKAGESKWKAAFDSARRRRG